MSRSQRRLIRALTGSVAALTLLLVGPVSGSHAHDELVGSEPPDGVELQTAPDQIELEFSGDIAPVGTMITVVGPGEAGPVTDGAPRVEGGAVSQPMSTDLPAGDYTVTWRVTSSDGHPISGEFMYSVMTDTSGSQATGETPPGTEPTDDGAQATQVPTSNRTGDPEADRAANTAAAPAHSDTASDSGTALWVWGVLALAVVTLGGLGAVAIRRR